MRIAFVGGGNMANALVAGMIAKGVDPRSVSVIEVSPAARERIAAHKVRVSTAPDAATAEADTLVIAVKPQDLRSALAGLPMEVKQQLVISIAAGVRLETLSRWLGGHRRLVRCMPNTPALVGAGVTGLYAPPDVGAEDRKKAEDILGAVGEVVWLRDERLLDVVTAVSGSGPAYVFWLIEQLADFAERAGIAREDALRLAEHCVYGAAQLAQEALAERLARALDAATRRGAELGELLGRD